MPSPDGAVDLRSDTVTTPTPEMRRAMAEAEVGDDVYGEDPTINRLEARGAELLGKEAGLYVPSGSMANQVALRALAPAGRVLCARRSHVAVVEAASCADAGLVVCPLPDGTGHLAAPDVEGALGDREPATPAVVTLENTYAAASGRPWRPGEVEAVAAVAVAHRVPLHCDGARLWNASVALRVPARDLVGTATTAMFCVSKGLAAPVGSVMVGPSDVVAVARDHRRRMGGAMRQAGVIAAAGLVALDMMVERMSDDHRRARRLADVLADRFPGSVDPEAIETNMVFAEAAPMPGDLLDRLAAEGVRALRLGAAVRFVTHKDVDDDDLDRVVKALDAIAA